MTNENREILSAKWQAIREACRSYHNLRLKSVRAGGARSCVCGKGGGASEACGMLAILKCFIENVDFDKPKTWERELITELKGMI